jgi:hypothetical protein
VNTTFVVSEKDANSRKAYQAIFDQGFSEVIKVEYKVLLVVRKRAWPFVPLQSFVLSF